MLPQGAAQLALAQVRRNRGCDAHRNPVLQVQEIGKPAVKAIGPDDLSGLRLAQFDCNAQRIAWPSDTAVHDVTDIEVMANPTQVERGAGVGLGRASCYDDKIL